MTPVEAPKTIVEKIRPELQVLVNKCFGEFGVTNLDDLMGTSNVAMIAGLALMDEIVRISAEAAAQDLDLPFGDVTADTESLVNGDKLERSSRVARFQSLLNSVRP